MSKLSVDISASARNGVSRILHGLDISNQKEIAEQLKVDPSTITRLKTDKKNNGLNEIEMFCELLSLLGLKVVPKDYQSIDKERVAALSVMNAAIEAQERFYQLEELTHMGGQAIAVRRLMEDGHKLIQVKEKSRIRYKINNEFIPPRIIRQLEMRGLVKLGAVTDV